MGKDFRLALTVFGAFSFALLAGNAMAAAQRTFVASTGADTNACSITAPCRGFAAAVAKTSANGEVIVLDSAGYGPVTLTKSISLIAPTGVYAGVTVFTGDGITVDGSGITVVLRGLSINGQGGQSGVNLLQAARLRVEGCVISNMMGNGILHTAEGAEMIVLDTILRDNLGNGIGVLAAASIVLDHVRSEHNMFDGLAMLSLSTALTGAVTDSVFAFNGRHGVNVAASISTSTPYITVVRSVMADNGNYGFLLDAASAHAKGGVTNNAIHRNASGGVRIVGGVLGGQTLVSDNTLVGNGGGIIADGLNLLVHVSNNRLSNNPVEFQALNSAVIWTYLNNAGPIGQVGTIIPVAGQ